MYTNQISADTFGADLVSALDFDSQPLQREIAYWWSTQVVDPTYNATFSGTPQEILDILLKMTPDSNETHTIGIFMRDGSGGHAIPPFAVQDQGMDASGDTPEPLYLAEPHDRDQRKQTSDRIAV